MAEGKKSFILYLTQRPIFEGLSDEDAGKLIKTVFQYVSDEHPNPSGMVGYSFNIIKPILKNDLVTYEDKKVKMSENAKKRWQAKESQDMQSNANASKSIQKDTDIDNVIVNDIDNVNGNDNDNNTDINNTERTSPAPASKPKKPVKHQYGEFKNVLMTDEEVSKLKANYPKYYLEYIEKLSEYMARTGKSYNSHYLTIIHWMKEAKIIDQVDETPKEKVKTYNILNLGNHRYSIYESNGGFMVCGAKEHIVELTTQQEEVYQSVRMDRDKLQAFIRSLI